MPAAVAAPQATVPAAPAVAAPQATVSFGARVGGRVPWIAAAINRFAKAKREKIGGQPAKKKATGF